MKTEKNKAISFNSGYSYEKYEKLNGIITCLRYLAHEAKVLDEPGVQAALELAVARVFYEAHSNSSEQVN